MSDRELWYRIPKWCALDDDPAKAGAAMWLLGRWDLGVEPSIAEVKRRTGWGWDKAAAFARDLWEWAGKADARRPEEAPGKSGSNRGGSTGKSGRLDVAPIDIVEAPQGGTGEAAGRNRGASYARDHSLGEREETGRQTPLPPADAAASPSAPKRPRKPSPDKPPPHPYHQRVIDAWDRVHREATRTPEAPDGQHYGGGDHCVLTGHEVKLLTGIRDGHLPRIEGPEGDAAMQRVGAAFRRYHTEALAGRAFPPGPPTVRGFCHDPAAWFAAESQHRARDAPTGSARPGRPLTFAELLAAPASADEQHSHPDAIDAQWRTA